ncbi:MAG: IS200/IS605 family element transposase accessory protein TnpB [Anaerolineae bacterium]|nr:IS200/IS605 family element transposase accessory protein TnpB [Anaerolineae bacterium]
MRTYKYLLRPNKEQILALDFLLWQSRSIYNAALEQRITSYQEMGKGIGYSAQWAHFRDLRRGNPETFGKLNTSSLQQLLRRVDKAFQAFFRRLKAGETPGFPRFKGRNRFKSIEYTYGDGCKLRQGENGRKHFYIQNVGEVRMCFHRPIPQNSEIKHAVIKQINTRWYVCLMVKLPEQIALHQAKDKQVGIDLGLKNLIALSNGTLINNPRWLEDNLLKLRCVQRHASRQTKNSQRQKQTFSRIASLHEHIANQRSDYLHKVANHLVREFDLVAIEDLSLSFMNHNRHLSRSSHDASLGELRQFLEYKAEEAGVQVVAVNPRNTSQICSKCGRIVSKELSVRVHACPDCGLILDRDVNAARNILVLALQSPPGRGGQAVTWAAAPNVA